MIPIKFPEANTTFGAPSDMDESQVMTIPGFAGQVTGGSCDGMPVVVVAWRPTPEELRDIVDGKPIFLSVFGGLPPHYMATSFEQAVFNVG